MKRRTKLLLIGLGLAMLGVSGVVMYIMQPHRDVVATEADTTLDVSALVNEFLKDANKANVTYLAEDGESTIVAITGPIAKSFASSDDRLIVVLQTPEQEAGFQCLFVKEAGMDVPAVGTLATIKGVLRSGPGYDEDLELYENGYLEKCSWVTD